MTSAKDRRRVPKVRVRLVDAERGFAYVDVVYVDEPERVLVAIGKVERRAWTGLVSGADYNKWLAHDNRGRRVGIHFATRTTAVNALWSDFVKRIGKAARREYGLALSDLRRSG